MERPTTIGVANAIRAGIRANFAPTDQEAELEKISEYFLDLAASLEMQIECYADVTSETEAKKNLRYSDWLGEIGWKLDKKSVKG